MKTYDNNEFFDLSFCFKIIGAKPCAAIVNKITMLPIKTSRSGPSRPQIASRSSKANPRATRNDKLYRTRELRIGATTANP